MGLVFRVLKSEVPGTVEFSTNEDAEDNAHDLEYLCAVDVTLSVRVRLCGGPCKPTGIFLSSDRKSFLGDCTV
jgi:hypothetical protein